MQRKAYNAPFRILVFITLFVIVSNAGAYFFISNARVGNQVRQFQYNFLIVFWPALLLAETITYRLVRRTIKPDKFIRIHIYSTLICFFVIPVVYIFLNGFLTHTNRSYPNYFNIIQVINQIRFYAFWLLFIVGHAFFITTIVNIFRKNDTPNTDNDQPAGILDGILDEY